jgi:polysaccharide chain length determinant protein (PEP-CTERM system associated)
MLGHRDMTMEDYLGILRRRIWLLILPPIAVCGAAYLVSCLLPSRYASSTQVLVQTQRVPTAIVQPIITGELNDRLASMKEQILSRTHLQPLVERFNLFNDSSLSLETRVQKLHDSIQVDAIQAMEQTRSTQFPGFKITVTLGSARLAQTVCAEISTLFLEEDQKSRESQAEGTTDFLDKALTDARNKMNDQDAKLAEFKGRYMGSLPDDAARTLGMISSVSAQLDAVTQGLDRDFQSKTFNESMLQQQLATWRASQNSATTTGLSSDTLQEQLKKAQDDLVKLRAQYTDEWPDVKNKVSEIEELKQKIAAAQATKVVTNPPEKTTDTASNDSGLEPAAIQNIRATLKSLDLAIRDKTRQQDDLRTKIHKYEISLQISPGVEQQYRQLTRDFTSAQDEYNSLQKSRGTAVRGAELERRQQGEQFHLLDPANLPERPTFPNRVLFAGGGFGGGLALGIALILMLEMKDKSLRTESDVELFLKIPTLAMVPVIDKRSFTGKRFVFTAGNRDGSSEANS